MRITIVDRQNYHLFQPMLYQVATAALSPGDIAQPIRAILRCQRNVRTLLGEVTAIEPARRRVVLADGELGYDYLILATGVRHTYFGHDEWAPLAPGLKTLDDALEVRRRILAAFEAAERATDPAERAAWLTFVIIGGGPTGVELAGAIAEIARRTIATDFRAIDPTTARVVLVEGTPRLLATFHPSLSAAAARALRALGVEVRTGVAVTEVRPTAVQVGDEAIPARTALWAAGIAASPLGRDLGVALDRLGRVQVAPDLGVPGHPAIFVAGDLAAGAGPDGRPLPGVCQVAMQGGQVAAGNVARALRGEATRPFRYRDLGSMATIGRAAAVADILGVRFGGPLAWLAWLTIHILYLIGFDNRLLVLTQWAWSFLTDARGARLITGVDTTAMAGRAPNPRSAPGDWGAADGAGDPAVRRWRPAVPSTMGAT